MVDSEGSEVCWRVELGIQTDDESHIALRKVREDIFKWTGQVGLLDIGGVGRYGGI